MKKQSHVIVSGRVQGVFFRDSTKQKAEQLCITGWVRNLKDGRVEAVFSGAEDAVKELIIWCHKGPAMAKVTDVTVKNMQVVDEFDCFTIRYD